MTTTPNNPANSIKCLIDAVDLPPSAFALPDDGRQRSHLCAKRKALVTALARYANPNGTSCHPSITTLRKITEIPRSTLFRYLSDLRTLGILMDGNLHPYFKTRIRALMLPVPSSAAPRPIFEESPVPSSSLPVPSSAGTRPIFTRTRTALDLPPTEPPKIQTCQPDPVGGQASEGVKNLASKTNHKTEAELWTAFIMDEEADLPTEMRHASPTEEERRKVLAQVDEIGPSNLGMAIGEWVDAQSPPLCGLKFGRWKRWLETGGSFLNDWK
jgi:hypothetical protein